MCLPVASEPVKATLATFGCSISGVPTSAPNPVTTFTNPFGAPACSISFTNSSTEAEVNSDGLMTTELPAARAGASFQVVSIKGEFHIEVNGVDHHVHDISTYSPITSGALLSSTFTNSRRVTGTDIHGHAVDLRLWDNGEPGKSTDRFWFNVNGTILGNAVTGNLIDQGNMQYHPNCRGPAQ